jgi:hypothetical protein
MEYGWPRMDADGHGCWGRDGRARGIAEACLGSGEGGPIEGGGGDGAAVLVEGGLEEEDGGDSAPISAKGPGTCAILAAPRRAAMNRRTPKGGRFLNGHDRWKCARNREPVLKARA